MTGPSSPNSLITYHYQFVYTVMQKTYLSLVLTMLFWGGTFIAGRNLAGSVPPLSAAFLRFAIATACLLFAVRIIDGRIPIPPPRTCIWLMLLGLTGVFSYNVLFFTGLQHIGAGRASLIIALNPLAITLAAALLLGEPLTKRQIAGVLLSLAGALFVISNGQPSLLLAGGFGIGELSILGCVVSWAAYSIIGRKVLSTLSPISSVFYSSLFGTLFLFLAAVAQQSLTELTHYSALAWSNLVFLGLFGTAIGFSLYYRAIQRIGATRAGIFINLVPLFSVLLSWIMLGERINQTVLAGGILLLAGVSLTNYALKPEQHQLASSASKTRNYDDR